MPPKIRAFLTAVVVVLTFALWFWRDLIGLAASPVFFFGLAALIGVSVWMFPEVKKDSDGR